jgi:pilus assembly protein CpaC
VVAPLAAGVPVPDLHYPDKFMPPNSNIAMHQSDAKSAENTLPPTPPTIPVETLVRSLQQEKTLVIEGSSGTFGASGAPINPGSTTTTTTGAPSQ